MFVRPGQGIGTTMKHRFRISKDYDVGDIFGQVDALEAFSRGDGAGT
jgi:hypothetical protein